MQSNFSKPQVFSLIVITIMGVVLSVALHKPLVLGFMPGFLFLLFLSKKQGVSFSEISKVCFEGVKQTKEVIIILFLVSFLLPSWYLSGTIDQMVSISLHILMPDYFFLLSFVIAAIFSMTLGTSVGTLSAIGIPIISTGLELGLPIEIIAGALVSGAFVGDRTSPFSSSHQLLAHTVEVPMRKQFRNLSLTTGIAVGLGMIFYSVLDVIGPQAVIPVEAKSFHWNDISLLIFLPPILLVVMVVLRAKIRFAFLVSIGAACLIALMNGVEILRLIRSLWFGVDGVGGGLLNMYLLLLFLVLAGAFNGLLEKQNVVQPLLNQWMHTPSSLLTDTVKTIVATFIIAVMSANQTLPIILTGRSFLPHWKKHHSKEQLARVMGDSTMLFPGMIPWSLLAIMCSALLGVPILSYLPFAIFLWILPFITIIISLRGKSTKGYLNTSKAS